MTCSRQFVSHSMTPGHNTLKQDWIHSQLMDSAKEPTSNLITGKLWHESVTNLYLANFKKYDICLLHFRLFLPDRLYRDFALLITIKPERREPSYVFGVVSPTDVVVQFGVKVSQGLKHVTKPLFIHKQMQQAPIYYSHFKIPYDVPFTISVYGNLPIPNTLT